MSNHPETSISDELTSATAQLAELNVEAVDLKFTDLFGAWHHCTVPLEACDADLLTQGLGFDGSSIRGWQDIHVSDLIALPDLSTLRLDPFFDQPTASFIADVLDPTTRLPYGRDPRQVAHRATEYLRASAIGDTCMVGPEPEFFIFDGVRFQQSESHALYEIESKEGAWNSALQEKPNLGYKPGFKSGYFPVSPSDSLHNLRGEMASELRKLEIEVEAHHHEVGTAGQSEIDMKAKPLLEMADQMAWFKYVVRNVARRNGKTATFMPKPIFRENGSGMHVHTSLWKGSLPLFSGEEYALLSPLAVHAIGGLLRHARAIMAFAAPTTNSYKRLVPGFEAPVKLVYSARNRSAAIRIPVYSDSPDARRFEFRCPDPSANGYLLFSAILMAMLDGITSEADPGRPLDENLYMLSEEALAQVPSVPRSLSDALIALEQDHAFLMKGNVFTKDLIEEWVANKRRSELSPMSERPHPFEFELYYHA